MRRSLTVALSITFAAMFALSPAFAKDPGWTRVPVQSDPGAIPLYPGKAPGSEHAKQKEIWTNVGTERWARNVTQPTLLPVLPDPKKATGAAVIVVPGGGFVFVSMDNEGYPIARWLADQGVAAFILKYRTLETPAKEAAFADYLAKEEAEENSAPKRREDGSTFAVADSQAALKLVAARAGEWGVDPSRIGMLGFSAGAISTLATTLKNDPAARPSFVGYIYGPMTAVEVPADAPPLFAALSSDDGLFGAQGFGLIESWRKAGRPAELHYFDKGGHGFGSYKRGVTSDLWFDEFTTWMRDRGLLAPTEAPKK